VSRGKKTSLLDIKFGELNSSYLEAENAPNQHSLSHRRTSISSAWRAARSDWYTPDLNVGLDSPAYALILRSTQQKRPLMTNSVQLLKANFNSTSVNEEVLVTEVPKYYTYKVWPLEYNSAAHEPPKSLSEVKGMHQGRINMAPDAFAEMGSSLEGVSLPPGLVCEYRYGNKYGIDTIVLTKVAGEQFQFQGVKIDDSWKGAVLQTHMNVPPAPQAIIPGNLMLIGDSQTSSVTFRSTLKAGLKAKGITMHAQWKSGTGVLAWGQKSEGDYWEIENPYGKLFSEVNNFRPEHIIIELGGNDSRVYFKKESAYGIRLRLWAKLLIATGAKIYWFGPSFSTQTGYDPLRQKIRDFQRNIFSNTSVTWYDMVPHTTGLTYQANDPGVHFDQSSYKTWAERLLAAAPLANISHTAAPSA